MNKPSENNPYWGGDITENQQYYFDITDEKKPLFTPVILANQQESCFLRYRQGFNSRHHSTSKDILHNLINGYNFLEKYKIKNNWYLIGRGTIFKLEIGEDNIENITPLILFCFDEYTNWDSKEGYKIVINNKEWTNPIHKTIKSKLSKIVDIYTQGSDVIFTNEAAKYCFNTPEKLKFKSIKQQSDFLTNLVKDTIGEIPVSEPAVVIQEEEEVAF